MSKTERITTADGWRLGVRVVESEAPRAVVVLLHAMMVDGRTMLRDDRTSLGGVLASRGFTVHVPDFRGRGLSGPTTASGASWTYDDLVMHDVPALVEHARRAGLPVAVVGHSLGGHVTAATLAGGHAEVDALVLMAANVWMPSLEPSPWARAAKVGGLLAFRGLARRFGGFPARRLGVGPVDEATPYVEDLARYCLRGRWGSRDGVEDWLRLGRGIDAPMLTVVGQGDRLLARPGGAVAWARMLGRVPPEVWVVGEGTGGLSHAPGHMDLVTDPRCRPVWERTATWLQRRLDG